MLFRPQRPLGRHFTVGTGPERFNRAKQSSSHVSSSKKLSQTMEMQAVHGPAAEPQDAPSSVAKSSLVMFLGTLMSRVLGLIRSPILLGAIVGMTSPAGNAFDVANKLPNLIYMVVVGGLVNAVLVPAIVRATKSSKDEGAAFINKLLTLAIVFLGAITIVLTLAAPAVVKIFAATMSGQWYSLTVLFAYWCLPQIFFYGLYTVLGQILNARENFGPYMWAPVVNNVVAVIGFLVILMTYGRVDPTATADASLWTGERVAMLGGISTLGIAAQALILIWPMRKLGIRFRPDFHWRNAGLGSAGKASWWVLLTMVVGMIPTIALSNVAAGATARGEADGMNLAEIAGNFTYTTAYTIYSIPTSLIVVSIATAMFTRLARNAANGRMGSMRRDMSKTLRMVSTLMALCSVLMIVLAVPISRIMAASSTPTEVQTLSRVVIAMCLGLTSVAAVNVLNRGYYALEDTRAAFYLNLPFQAAGLLGYIACMFLHPMWTVVGIGLVMSLTNTGAVFVLGWGLAKRMGGIEATKITMCHLKLIIICGITLFVGSRLMNLVNRFWTVDANIFLALLSIIILTPIISGLYLSLMKLLNMKELAALAGPANRVLAKVGIKK